MQTTQVYPARVRLLVRCGAVGEHDLLRLDDGDPHRAARRRPGRGPGVGEDRAGGLDQARLVQAAAQRLRDGDGPVVTALLPVGPPGQGEGVRVPLDQQPGARGPGIPGPAVVFVDPVGEGIEDRVVLAGEETVGGPECQDCRPRAGAVSQVAGVGSGVGADTADVVAPGGAGLRLGGAPRHTTRPPGSGAG
ncbi:hypothetical protein [Pseudonocardia sp. ICBG1293]|uniref:hypothetical protein n=1 Tax=Pseudonocardia sp. ICBG1293 TaxID=2844382 RepID=UPI001CD03979|nr:hypothetical protein [Pseudonocardia sp. ICBG1293]